MSINFRRKLFFSLLQSICSSILDIFSFYFEGLFESLMVMSLIAIVVNFNSNFYYRFKNKIG